MLFNKHSVLVCLWLLGQQFGDHVLGKLWNSKTLRVFHRTTQNLVKSLFFMTVLCLCSALLKYFVTQHLAAL